VRAIACAFLGLGCVQVPRDTADSFGGSGEDARCPVWASISPVGSQRTFETTDSYETSTGVTAQFTSEIVSMTATAAGLDVLLEVEGSMESDNWQSYSYQTTSHYLCDDAGAWLVTSETHATVVTDVQTVESLTETVYTDALIMPRLIELGDTWQGIFAGTTTDSTGNTSSHSVTIDSEVTATDTVSVGAGSFSALVISEHFDDGSQSEYRVAEGPGFLLSETYELMDYQQP